MSSTAIGQNSVNHTDHFVGEIDEVRVYNRAFSDAEVLNLYEYESVADPSRPLSGPVVEKFDTESPNEWTVDAADVVAGYPFELGGSLSVLSAGDSGLFLAGGNPNLFDGFWVAHHPFLLPTNAVDVQITYGQFTTDDRGVMLLNGIPIVGSGPVGAGQMVFRNHGPLVAFTFPDSHVQAGLQTTGFQSGTNTLDFVVNNTGTGGVGPLKRPVPPDATSLFVYGQISYYTQAPPPIPQLTLRTSAEGYTLTASVLSPGATYQLQSSGDLGTWTNDGPLILANSRRFSQAWSGGVRARFVRIVWVAN